MTVPGALVRNENVSSFVWMSLVCLLSRDVRWIDWLIRHARFHQERINRSMSEVEKPIP